MYASDTAARLASAAFAVVLTVASLAYAIIPASPALMA
ncbi:MAG: enoyl-CoA hydratase [Erythrobacter sp.]